MGSAQTAHRPPLHQTLYMPTAVIKYCDFKHLWVQPSKRVVESGGLQFVDKIIQEYGSNHEYALNMILKRRTRAGKDIYAAYMFLVELVPKASMI